MDDSAPSAAHRRAGGLTALVCAIGAGCALFVVGGVTASRALATLRDDGIAWPVPIDQQPISATTDSGTIAVEGFANEAVVIVRDVAPAAVAAIIGALALWAVAAVVVIGAVALLARNLLRGAFFVRSTVVTLDTIGWTLVLAPIAILLLERIGTGGVLAALGLDGESVPALDAWPAAPLFAAGVTVGLLAVAFRRGIRLHKENRMLQKETEGLV